MVGQINLRRSNTILLAQDPRASAEEWSRFLSGVQASTFLEAQDRVNNESRIIATAAHFLLSFLKW